ncbi:DNA polymerase [Desulfurobacterium sp.]
MNQNATNKIIASLIKKVQRINVQNPENGKILTHPAHSLKLTPEELAFRHLSGFRRIGIYPEVESGRVVFGAVDLDLKDEPEEKRQFYTLEVYRKLVSLGFKPFIEKSKSKGYHVWVFFSEPVSKETVRWILNYAVSSSSYPNKKLLEVFPKGTALFLPMFASIYPDGSLRREFLNEKRNAVLKPENLNQYMSNWTALFERYAVQNTETIKLLEKLKTLPPCFLRAYENWEEGNRNGYACGLAGVCKNVLKMTEEEAEKIILSIAEAKGDEELKLREIAVYRTYEQDKTAGCSILKGKNGEITIAVPVCDGDCEFVRKLKEEKARKKTQIKVVDKFIPDIFAEELSEKFLLWFEGSKKDFWIFDEEEGIWKNNAEDKLKGYLHDSDFLPQAYRRQRYVNELVESVKYKNLKEEPLPEPPPELIPFKNGVYDLEKDTFRPYRKDDYFTFRLPWNYREGAGCPLIDRIFQSLVPEDRVVDLYELAAYCLWRGYPYQKFFILYGKGRNGKSAFIQILTRLLGDNAYSSVPLEELLGGGFQLSELHRKLANISGELSYSDIKESSYLKMLTGEDTVTAPRKFKKPITFRNHAKMIFLTNQVPLTHDTTEAFYRRVFLIEFPYKFLSEEEQELHLRNGYPKELLKLRDPKLLQQLLRSQSEFEGLAYKSIQILKRLRGRGFIFTNDKPVEELRALYDRVSNPLLQFIEEFCVRDPEGIIFKREFREKFWEWQRAKGINLWNDRRIGNTMKKVFGFEEGRPTNPATRKPESAWKGIKWKDYSLFSTYSLKENEEKKGGNSRGQDCKDCNDCKDVSESLLQTETREIFGKKVAIPAMSAMEDSVQGDQGVQGISENFSGEVIENTFEKKLDTLDTLDTDSDPDIPDEIIAAFCGISEEEIREKEEVKDYITDDSAAQQALEKLESSSILYLDIETYSEELPRDRKDQPALDPFRNQVRLISLGNGENFYTFDVQKLSEESINAVLELISEKLIVGHNLKFDLKTLAAKYGSQILPDKIFDSYIAERLLWNAENPERPPKGVLSLSALAEKYTERKLDKTLQTSDFGGELTEEQIAYALEDVKILPTIVEKQVEKLNRLSSAARPNKIGLKNPSARLEMAFLPVLVKVELAGIPVNTEYLEEKLKVNKETFTRLYTEIKTGHRTDPLSPKQLLTLLRNRLNLPIESTSSKELQKYKDNEIVSKILTLRKVKKKADLIEKYLQTKSGRLYPEFNQLEAHSGRMSCRNPNVQQIPRDLKENFYKAPEGRAIIKADYPAIELRLASVIAPDRTMIKAFKEGKDLHKYTASLISGKPLEEVTKEERQRAKALNFGFIYGMSAETFREYAFTNYGVELTQKEAEEFRKKFFEAYSGIAQWHRKTANMLNLSKTRKLQVWTRLKRAIAVNKLTSALNFPVQGSGADLLKMAAVFFTKDVEKEGIDARIINLVHDEIVVECCIEDKERASQLLKEAMERACSRLITEFYTEVEVEEVEGEAERRRLQERASHT